jgi:hypothetical protein
MTKYRTIFAVSLCTAIWILPALAETQTVAGEVISLNCYVQNKRNVGKVGHLCAVADVKWDGNPPALLTADGKVYMLTGAVVAGNNAKIVPYLGQQVTVSGEVSEHLGLSILTANDLTAK